MTRSRGNKGEKFQGEWLEGHELADVLAEKFRSQNNRSVYEHRYTYDGESVHNTIFEGNSERGNSIVLLEPTALQENSTYTQGRSAAEQLERGMRESEELSGSNPSTYVIAINENTESVAGAPGNHWTVAVVEKLDNANLANNERPAISVSYINPTEDVAEGELSTNAQIFFAQLQDRFNVDRNNFTDMSRGQQNDGFMCGYIAPENAFAIVTNGNIRDSYEGGVKEELYNNTRATLARLQAQDLGLESGLSAPEMGGATPAGKKVRFDTSPPEVREYSPDTPVQPQPAKSSPQRELGSNPYLDKDGMDDFDLNMLMQSYFVEDKQINYFDAAAESLGIPNPGKPSVMVGQAVSLDNLGDKFEQMVAQRNKAAQEGELPDGISEPNKFIVPVNVQYEGDAFKKGDHWVLAVMQEEKGEKDGKQNVSVQFVDSGYTNGQSPNYEKVLNKVGEKFNVDKSLSRDLSLGDVNAIDPNEREPQQSDNNSCGLLVCQNALELVKDPSGDSLRRYNPKELEELGREKDRRIPLEDFKAGRHKDNPAALRTQLGAVNETIKSYQDLLSDGVPAAEVVNGVFDFLEGDPNRKKGQKNGVIGRLDNFVEDFDVDSPVFTVYSIIANTLGLLIDAAKIAIEKGMAYQGSMKNASIDLEGLEEKRDTLNEKIRQQKMKEIRGRTDDGIEGAEEEKGILSNRAGSDKKAIGRSEGDGEGLKGKAGAREIGGESEEISLGKSIKEKNGNVKMEDVGPGELGSLSPSAGNSSRGKEGAGKETSDDIKEQAAQLKATIAASSKGQHRSSIDRTRNPAYNQVSPSRSQ